MSTLDDAAEAPGAARTPGDLPSAEQPESKQPAGEQPAGTPSSAAATPVSESVYEGADKIVPSTVPTVVKIEGHTDISMTLNLDHGGHGAGHDLIRALVDGFAHRSSRGARRSASRLFAGGLLAFRLFGRRQVPRGACGAGGLGGVVESAHIIPAYAVKNLFQEVTLSCDYTGEA